MRKLKLLIKNLLIYIYDYKKEVKYSTALRDYKTSQESLLSKLVVDAHTIEKGLTMPSKKFNFGHAKVLSIAQDIFYYANHYDVSEERFIDVVGILKEYERFHKINSVNINSKELIEIFDELNRRFPLISPLPQAYSISKDEYFADSKGDFYEIAHSRHSCRNLSGKVPEDILNKALELAQTAPSTCNRQSVRVHILKKNDEILNIQHGNRGFGHLADKFLLITSDLSDWPGGHQRNAPYVDGGIFLMNMLYSLHYYGIGACTLNMYLDRARDSQLHYSFAIPHSEVPIALIAIGIPPEKFDVAHSTRRKYNNIIHEHTI